MAGGREAQVSFGFGRLGLVSWRGHETASGNRCNCGVFELLESEISLNSVCTVSPYRAVNTLRLGHKIQPVNAV